MNHYLIVIWMYLFFHNFGSLKYANLTLSADISTEIFTKLPSAEIFSPQACPERSRRVYPGGLLFPTQFITSSV
jgi:hypothetical protein